MPRKIKVQVLENSPLEEAGLRCLVAQCDDLENVKESDCTPNCNQNCASELPDVIVMEMNPNGSRSIDCIRQIHARYLSSNILAVCPLGEPIACKMAMSAGAIGFISKKVPPPLFINALRQVAKGKPFVEPWVAKRMVETSNGNAAESPFELLSKREYAVLQLMLTGENNKSIAEQLHISESTLGNHRSQIRSKLGVSNLVELTRMALRHGMIEA